MWCGRSAIGLGIGFRGAGAMLVGLALATAVAAQDRPTGRENLVPGGLDTEHIFGFTEGSDIGVPGEIELETEITGRSGRRVGRFRAVDGGVVLKVPLADFVRIAPGISVHAYDLAGMPGLDDRSARGINGAFLETRLRLLDRRSSPVGLTLNVVPGFGGIDGGSGRPAASYGTDAALLADWEIVPGSLVAAVNLGFSTAAVRVAGTGERLRGSGAEVGAAFAYEVGSGLFLGAEARYARAYDGLGLNAFLGEAVYVGPTLYTTLTPQAWISVAWNAQVAGDAPGERGGLDLTNFDRHQVRIRVGYNF